MQTVLFLTDYVFYVLFAYIGESMGSSRGYEPWRSWNAADITPLQIYNEFTTIHKGLFAFLTLTELMSFLFSFVL